MPTETRKYYAAYEERYKAAHAMGVSWETMQSTPIVLETLQKYRIGPGQQLLEVGCGEGRDAKAVLEQGYDLTATDLSAEAIAYCQKTMPEYAANFSVLDCLAGDLPRQFDFIYAVAVVHMLVLDEDRNSFYRFIGGHLKPGGLALICTMGDGTREWQSDIRRAFELQEREHPSGKRLVAGTTCRMVSFRTFEEELRRNGLEIVQQGITGAMPNFNSLMYAVVRQKS